MDVHLLILRLSYSSKTTASHSFICVIRYLHNSNENLQNTDCLSDYDEEFDQVTKTNFNTIIDLMSALGCSLNFSHLSRGAYFEILKNSNSDLLFAF